MSDVPNIPPPPPPFPLIVTLTSKHTTDKDKSGDECYYSDIQIPTDGFKWLYSAPVGSVLQTGPNCGLAALSMVSTSTPKFLSIDKLYSKAKALGFTKNGEMFSVKNMAQLAHIMLNPYYKIELISGGLETHYQLITESLCKGNLLLVPYDADKNNEPCCKKGHAAHWAVLCGLVEHHNGTINVIGRQGKSKYPSVWPILTLAKSNSNLTEVDPKRDDEKEYLLPMGGIIEGLANQFIVLTKCFNILKKD